MSELTDLYQEMILDHNRNPRNFQKMEGADRTLEGFNPLCGDRLTLFVKMEGDRIKELSFIGSGCAISKASSSLMTAALRGKTKKETTEIFNRFHKMVLGEEAGEGLGKLSIFAGVRDFPTRVKCATLAWHTLSAILEGKNETISTEGSEDDK